MNAAALQTQIDALRQQTVSLEQALAESRRENTVLRQKLDALARRIFGKKSEQLDAAQLQLLLSGLAQGALVVAPEKSTLPALSTPRRARTQTQRLRTPDNLEVVREVIEPQIVQAQPQRWKCSRAAKCLDSLLGEDFKGKLQCDGYSAYPAFAKAKQGVKLFGCLAHARRGFFEAQEQAPQITGWILNQIGILYGWEEQLRQSRAGPGGREARRASHSRMVMQRLRRALEKLKTRYLPQSPMGQAISYALNQWSTLERFLEHGEVEIDNNLVENAIPPTAIGKKNWLFFGSEEAGRRNAVIYTLIQNCRMHDVEPGAYLKNVLERLPTTTNQHVAELTPLNWKKAREKSLKQAA